MSAKQKKLDAMEEEPAHYNGEDSTSSSEDEDGERHPDAYTGNEEVQIDFEGRAPVDPDCDGITQLLSRLFLRAHIDCKAVATQIIGQNYVGSVICQCETDGIESESDDDMYEDDTIFGITTVLNINAKKDVACVQQLRDYILKRAEKHAPVAMLKKFQDAFNSETQQVGFLINERFINIPAQISVPLLENLVKEMHTATQKGMKFDFTYLLMLVKFYRKEARKGKPAEDFYTNAEEEVICATEPAGVFEYSVSEECDTGMTGDWLEGDATLTPYRKVLLFDAKQMQPLIAKIQKFISGE